MNYFSHYFYERPVSSSYFTAGLMLPDLLHGFNALYKPLIEKVKFEKNAPDQEIVDGITAHLKADKVFHSSDFFREMNEFTLKKLKAFPFINRSFFLSHIAIELCLDRVLIKQNPDLIVEYYNLLRSVDKNVLLRFFSIIGKRRNSSLILQRFERFNEVAFLMFYTDNEKFLKALSNLYFRSIQEAPSFSFIQIEHIFNELEEKIEQTQKHFFSQYQKNASK